MDIDHHKIDLKNYTPESFDLAFFTCGGFRLFRKNTEVPKKEWGRDKTLQLIQFLLTLNDNYAIHKEVIIDRIWPDESLDKALSDFKVAMHGVQKVLEPQRPKRAQAQYLIRDGQSYHLENRLIWSDAKYIDLHVKEGMSKINIDKGEAMNHLQKAVSYYHGPFLPQRTYEDWSSSERERIQILILNAMIQLAELQIKENPRESIRMLQEALRIDETLEDAYRLSMQAYMNVGNRPGAIKVYKTCCQILEENFGLSPLPTTQQLFENILVS